MKKAVLILVITCGILALTGCGKKEPVKVELNAENFNDYIILDVQLEDYEKESERGLLQLMNIVELPHLRQQHD